MAECIGVKFDNGPKIHYVEAPRARRRWAGDAS